MVSTGFKKRGRGYGEVEVSGRYKLPAIEAVKYKWPGGEWSITSSDAVLSEKPLSLAEQELKLKYRELTDALTDDWQSMSELRKKMTGWPGVWGMCKKLERAGLVEMREFQYKRGANGWRCEARKK